MGRVVQVKNSLCISYWAVIGEVKRCCPWYVQGKPGQSFALDDELRRLRRGAQSVALGGFLPERSGASRETPEIQGRPRVRRQALDVGAANASVSVGRGCRRRCS